MKWTNLLQYIPWPIKIVHVHSPIISQQELIKRSNNGLRDVTCVSIFLYTVIIYIYILSFFLGSNFRQTIRPTICLRFSLQLRLLRLLWLLLCCWWWRCCCRLFPTDLRSEIKQNISHIHGDWTSKKKTDSQTQCHAHTCHELKKYRTTFIGGGWTNPGCQHQDSDIFRWPETPTSTDSISHW